MENKIPFTSYDFWVYLSAGFLFLFIADLVAGTGMLARDSWTVGVGMTFRYLKFYSHYAVEVFTSFAYSKEK